MQLMKILSIETSCDETGVAVIEATGNISNTTFTVLGNALQSQVDAHIEFGGVFPTVAKREHAKNIIPVLREALSQSDMLVPQRTPPSAETLANAKTILDREPEALAQLEALLTQYDTPNIDAIAVTVGPGLDPALWVGVNTARALAAAWNLPVVPVNHMEGHVIAALQMQQSDTSFAMQDIEFPAVVLLVSGGHTELLGMKNWCTYERLGETRDDAAGEAFDKSARMMGLPYPGGPQISELAHHARTKGLDRPYQLPRPMLHSGDFDFSFSGLKNAVRLLLEEVHTPTEQQKQQIAREVEDAIVETLVTKAKRALNEHGAQTLIVSGGVSANTYLKAELQKMTAAEGADLFVSTPTLATDNGLMIAFAGALQAQKNTFIDPAALRSQPNLQLGS